MRLLWLVSSLALALLIAVLTLQVPAPAGADAPATAFSAERAMVDIREIAQRPHPVGSADQARVGAVLLQRMAALGLQTSTQTGALSPAREAVSALWTVPGGAGRSLLDSFGLGAGAAAGLSALALAIALGFGLRRGLGKGVMIGAGVVGFAVTMGWALTALIAAHSFEVVAVSSVTFTGPATDTLMALVAERQVALSFGIGLVPGVFVGAAAVAMIFGEWRLERFGADTPMERYLIGAVLMGFGAMLAGGCAVGAGVSGGAVFSTTAFLAVFAMWIGAMTTVRLMAWRAGLAQTV
jgi:uncharacterized membrane protein YedE/YeeE